MHYYQINNLDPKQYQLKFPNLFTPIVYISYFYIFKKSLISFIFQYLTKYGIINSTEAKSTFGVPLTRLDNTHDKVRKCYLFN